MKKSVEERLNTLLQDSVHDKIGVYEEPYLENRIFTNRSIKFSRIKAIGFDMDYTLAQYNQKALEELTMELTFKALVEERDYPEEILKIPYKEAFAIRGLVIDTERGHVLKMDKFKYVSLAYHGLQPVPSESRSKLYNTSRVNLKSDRYRSIDTLFELLETYLFAALIDYFEVQRGEKVDYKKLFLDIRSTIDRCHSDGSLKRRIMEHPETYINDDPMLIPALHQFREAGKRMFVVTNSEPDYTDFMLSWLFRNASPFFRGWRECFEVVCASARKPKFFNQGEPLKIIEENDCLFFSGGTIDYLEEQMQIGGDEVLYVGDHIYGDILKTKHSSHWRTCIIVPELEFQIRAEREARPHIQTLFDNESERKQTAMELNWLRTRVEDLHQFKEAEADELEMEQLELIDSRIAELNRRLESNSKKLSGLLCSSRELRRTISAIFNPYWGRLFKTGGQLSAFAEQIRDYACIYTSAVSNFNFYSTQTYFQSTSNPMPHEKTLYSLGDLNFDATLTGKGETPLPENEQELEEREEREQAALSN